MKMNLQIKIKRRSVSEWMMWLLVFLPFAFGLLINFLHLPNLIKYTLDVAWLLLLVYVLVSSRTLDIRKVRALIIWIILFFLYSVVNYVLNYQSVLYYLWGFRCNFRFYVAMIVFSLLMDSREGEWYLQLFDKLFWVEFWLCLVQYFLLGYYGDFLGGLFGVVLGSNGYLNIFYTIIIARSILQYLNKIESMGSCLLKCAAALLVAALAELKFFFVEFCVIVVVAVLITDFSWRKLSITLASLVGVALSILLLGTIYPFFKEVFSFENLLALASNTEGYTYRGDLNRLTVIPEINKRFFDGLGDQLFGFGLGNCDYSGFDFLVTPFYKRYGWTHYNWFSSATMYLEMGWGGLVFFFGFFLLSYRKITKLQKAGDANPLHCQLARIVSICCILIAIYNSSLRMEAGYMVYFVLALPFMKSERRQLPLEGAV